MKAKTVIKIILTITALAAVLVVYIRWMNAHDAEMDNAMDAYNACVTAQYGTTVAAYYQQHQTMPTCNE